MHRGLPLRPWEVYAGRPKRVLRPQDVPPGRWGWLGNPFSVQEHGAEALPLFEAYFRARVAEDARFRSGLLGLPGKTLLCWCIDAWDTSQPAEPVQCHAQVIARWIDAHRDER